MRINILAFAAGVGLLQLQAQLPPAWATAALLLGGALFALLPLRLPHAALRLLVPLAYAALGCGWAAMLAHERLGEFLPAAWEGRDIRVVGVVASLPQTMERGERFEFAVEHVETEGAQVPGRILLSWYRGRADAVGEGGSEEVHGGRSVRPGERWRFIVRLKRPHGAANPQGFDYEAWLLERDLRATGYVRPRAEAQRLDAFVARPAYVVERLRERVRANFEAALPDGKYAGVLVALAVGDQRAIPPAQWLLFRQTGITHLMSISGLHVTMVGALFAALAGWAWRRSERLTLALPAQKAAVVAGWAAAFAYALLAGFSVPTQRTLWMLTVVAVALCSGRNPGASRTLLLALLAVLLLDPWAFLAPGFWLSFAAVGLLFYAGSARLGEAAGWRAMALRWGVTQWAVTLGTLPILLLLFQQFSLVAPLANAVAIPLVSFVVTPLALLFAVLPWAPLLHVDHWLLEGLMRLIETLAGWPLWEQAVPPLAAVLLALLGALWLLLPRGFPARSLGLFLLLPALFWPPPRPPPGAAWIDVLDVGHGLAVVVRTARHALLYDAGPQYGSDADAGQRVVLPFLRAVGVRRLDTLLVSHRDKDHAGGVGAVRAALPVTRLLASFDVADEGWAGKTVAGKAATGEAAMGEAATGGAAGGTTAPAALPAAAPATERCAAGQQWEWDGVRFRILHPAAGDYARPARNTNSLSCVLRIENDAGSMLLTGDIEAPEEQALLRAADAKEALATTVLLAAHHGSRSSTTVPFLAAVAPRDVIFSAAYRDRFRHPHPEVLERIGASTAWRTDRDGAVRVELDGAVVLQAQRALHRRYWHGQ